MKYVVIIPAHNEANYLSGLLESLFAQSTLPAEVVLVNDQSTDETEKIMQAAVEAYPNTQYINQQSSEEHLPGAKVVAAFMAGFKVLSVPYDVVVKLDADLLLPPNYFEKVLNTFQAANVGVAGGVCYEQNSSGQWVLNHPMKLDHVRGAFKAYHTRCFDDMQGLRSAMGWDTVDELLARYYGYEVKTLTELKVKHLRPVGTHYKGTIAQEQGQAFYRMRYGFLLSVFAALKGGWTKKSVTWIFTVLKGYLIAFLKKPPYLVDKKQGRFIRSYRWKRLGKQ